MSRERDTAEGRALLRRVHELRIKAHWGKPIETPWPETDKDWRQTNHGAPWDTNVHMAEWHLKFYHTLKENLHVA